MAKYSADLDRAFSALADPTRRAIVSRLCNGPKSVSELSEPFDLALPSLLKHVRVLETAGSSAPRRLDAFEPARLSHTHFKRPKRGSTSTFLFGRTASIAWKPISKKWEGELRTNDRPN